MKKPVLIIGSTCVDIIINIDHLPATEENLRPSSQSMALGGCAFNVANILRQTGAAYTFLTPVGSGIYGDFVEKELKKKGFEVPVRLPEENGCCYCLVEAGGERTFMSYHGVEYTFQKEWMKPYRAQDYSMVYVCGLEVEESTGENLVSWLEENPGPEIFFAPGPRGKKIRPDLLERMWKLHPVLHINQSESRMLSGLDDLEAAAEHIRRMTGNAVVITLGDKGAYLLKKEGAGVQVPGVRAQVADTIGAGDSHIGALLSCLYRGMDMETAIGKANQVSAAVVGVHGSSLPDDAAVLRME